MKRDPNRPKAADIEDAFVLKACAAFGLGRAPDPVSLLVLTYPAKVVRAKFEKLRERGLLDSKDRLTEAGRRAIEGEEKAS